jgi:4-alpha-glucanotransferase
MELFDQVRLDHFRAFAAYWEVPAGSVNAQKGEWKKGPGERFFRAVQKTFDALPFVAEDLGEIDEEVYELRDAFHMPGMKVLQFAFGGDMPRSVHIPHRHEPHFLVYTGTHDNNTTRGWFNSEADESVRLNLESYLGKAVSGAEISLVFCRMAMASVAQTAIIPMQDLLNLDERSRMNTPASAENNWTWRLLPGQLNEIAADNLLKWTRLYGRD